MPLPFYWRKPVHTFPAVTGDLLVRLYQSLVIEVKKMAQSQEELFATVSARLDKLEAAVSAAADAMGKAITDRAALKQHVIDLEAKLAAAGVDTTDFAPLLKRFDDTETNLEQATASLTAAVAPAEPPASA